VGLRTGDNFTLGSSFTVGANPVLVTSLGVWDSNIDGLASSKQVGIWTLAGSAGTLVTSAIVPSGTAGTLVGEFRYTPVTPIVLSANTAYTVGVFYPTGDPDQLHDHSPITGGSGEPSMSGDFNSFSARFSATTGSFVEPIGGTAGFAYVGGNFQYTVVPEPGSLVLGLGGIAMVWVGRRSRPRP
jgi:hypothetical protein